MPDTPTPEKPAVVPVPESEFRDMKVNGVFCCHCQTEVRSTHHHDFRACKCEDEEKRVYVDGGLDYIRRGWGSKAKWYELDDQTGEVITEKDGGLQP